MSINSIPQQNQESAGGIVFYRSLNKIETPLLKTIDGNWMIAKGHIKKEELPEQAATREIKEELGIRNNLSLIEKIAEDNFNFSFPGSKKVYFKKVHIFLFEITRKTKLNPAIKEKFTEAKWFSIKEAAQKLSPSIFTKERYININGKIVNKNCDQAILLKAEEIYNRRSSKKGNKQSA